MRQRGLLLVTLLALIAAPLAGCIQADPGTLEGATTRTDEDFRLGLPYDVSDTWSHPLVNGTLKGLPVEVLELPSHDGTILRVGVYRPDVPEGTKVPVIIDAGPYYGRGEGVVESSTDDRLANFLIENFVPHGYAVVLAAIRGTGNSGGCIELMSEAEQKDMDFLTTTFGEMEWSNGAVAYIGKSYDGTTPWMAAQYGNPYLKTIVPMQGLSSIRDLMFRNGTSETRGPIMHNGVYWPFGLASEGRSTENQLANVCPEALQGLAMGPYAVVTGDGASPTNYWEVRHFYPKVLENYNGSIFFVHGFQDWNVEPSMVTDVYNKFQGDKKLLMGQWGHHYPDRPHENKHSTRADFAETLLRWFDKYLKGKDVYTGPAVEVEDAQGVWRVEPQNAFPPLDANWTTLYISADGSLGSEPGESGSFPLAPLVGYGGLAHRMGAPSAPMSRIHFETEPLAEDLRLSGMPRVHLTAIPSGPGGHLFATLYDYDGKTETRIGHAAMDLRFAAGDGQMRPVVPGMPLEVKMELFALDYLVAKGHSIHLVISQESEGEPGLDPIPNPSGGIIRVTVGGDALSEVHLPVIVRDQSAFDLGWKPLVKTDADEAGGA